MAKRRTKKDWLDKLSDWLAHNKGLPVFVGVGLALINLILSFHTSQLGASGTLGWLMRTDLLLHLGVIIALLGILVGDAL
jgi:hypothetical protein